MLPFILWESASKENVLPLTSACNLRCVFCSNRQNPRGVRVFAVPHLPLPLVKSLIPCLDPGRKIIIGEAATRINEGEPFTHPQVWQALGAVRERYPQAMLQITTNGAFLDRVAVKRLAAMQPLEVNLSLNSATREGRRLLMGDCNPGRVLDAVRLLGDAGVTCHGSLVAMPHLVGWPDLAGNLQFPAGSWGGHGPGFPAGVHQTGRFLAAFRSPGHAPEAEPVCAPAAGTDGYPAAAGAVSGRYRGTPAG